MTDDPYAFAAVTIGVFLGILQERYSEDEILRMLEPWRIREALEIVGDNDESCGHCPACRRTRGHQPCHNSRPPGKPPRKK